MPAHNEIESRLSAVEARVAELEARVQLLAAVAAAATALAASVEPRVGDAPTYRVPGDRVRELAAAVLALDEADPFASAAETA